MTAANPPAGVPDPGFHERLTALAEKRMAAGEVYGEAAADPVNLPMIRHWAAAMGDANPLHTDAEAAAAGVHGEIVAPPAMIQVWTMPGLAGPAGRTGGDGGSGGQGRAGDQGPGGRAVQAGGSGEHGPDGRPGSGGGPIDDVLAALDAAGYTGVVATNCEQTYDRYLRLGERPVPATRLTGLSGPKRTALGEGYFVTWNVTWYSEGERVAQMLFRVLKFHPEGRKTTPDTRQPYPLGPAVNDDTAFFWEGVARGELRIQRCADCGELRHPPGPVCPSCRSAGRTYVVASGEGEVYSYVVHHNPPVPGWETPFAVAVVQLPEGVRIVGAVVDCAPAEVGIGMPLRVTYRQKDDNLILPLWVPRET
ncbi:bifunctional MaoC family dehydratase N-terminal/OB-fold nucleic acid binding domain-containing protein [Streptosporangium pseudovulgare]|uniref:DNA-binding protein n=1 Tax=Streptosporangium pseudovulgare TaxID=35765 RepID=A0ABQ2R068_9ACTN|nr:bifunctional MaoC family dehydratase N-terminal/OB-fold nucleic acid binding domain-containing protein [Streptosporangium pseudovulgare]GGQ02132.1 DNA-binding protein [Streptosporangium pseudovulgare]